MSEQPIPVNFQINLPPDRVEGHYADFASVWHNQETFILDFAAMSQPPQLQQIEDGTPTHVIPAQVVTRVRIPAAQCFELMKALHSQLAQWEAERGIVPPPGEAGPEVPDTP